MRKADYAALAAIIRESIAQADEALSRIPDNDYAEGSKETLKVLARRFADVAHVDRAEFRRACGIDT
jgi:hypothetical protein